MRINPVTYSAGLARSLGLGEAYRLAEELYDSAAPSQLQNLPVGDIFYRKTDDGKWVLLERQLRKTHAFWKQVFFLLDKRLPPEKRLPAEQRRRKT